VEVGSLAAQRGPPGGGQKPTPRGVLPGSPKLWAPTRRAPMLTPFTQNCGTNVLKCVTSHQSCPYINETTEPPPLFGDFLSSEAGPTRDHALTPLHDILHSEPVGLEHIQGVPARPKAVHTASPREAPPTPPIPAAKQGAEKCIGHNSIVRSDTSVL